MRWTNRNSMNGADWRRMKSFLLVLNRNHLAADGAVMGIGTSKALNPARRAASVYHGSNSVRLVSIK